MSREAHVRFWEGVGVKLPRATHFMILSESHLHQLLRGYVTYYNTARPHQSLHHNRPQPREVHPPELGRVVSIPQVGGLHHLYQRAA
jgi:putative transposase